MAKRASTIQIVQCSIKFVFDEKVDPKVLEGYTNVELTGLKPGLTTVYETEMYMDSGCEK